MLFPFSLLYWLGIAIRNFLYDNGILKSTGFALPLICVGNLSTGGTGKSPMVEYLVELLKVRFRVATLSRGYKRKTRGYVLANANSTALEIGDEPMQFHQKFPQIPVAVGEERLVAIPQLLQDKPETEVIILDDAFQHRAVKAGLNILLTDYNSLFTRDFYLPTGDLRDLKKNYKRAEIIIITKCKEDLTAAEKAELISEIKPVNGQQVFFTSIEYAKPRHFITHKQIELQKKTEVLLVAGIANPLPLKKMLEQHHHGYQMLQYPDHHIFTIDDWKEITGRLDAINTADKIILTTEKDAVRLEKFKPEMQDTPIYVMAVRHKFLFEEAGRFNNAVIDFMERLKNAH
jgi:tetraacyldisaccharide 4'-kinase